MSLRLQLYANSSGCIPTLLVVSMRRSQGRCRKLKRKTYCRRWCYYWTALTRQRSAQPLGSSTIMRRWPARTETSIDRGTDGIRSIRKRRDATAGDALPYRRTKLLHSGGPGGLRIGRSWVSPRPRDRGKRPHTSEKSLSLIADSFVELAAKLAEDPIVIKKTA